MIGPTLALALLAAAPDTKPPAAKPPSAGPEDLTLAAPPFETHGFSKKDKDVSFYSEHFASRLSANGLQVITPQQISSVKEMDKLRQLAGCPATSADCIIELGHMLGAQGVVRGTLAKVGEIFQVDVRVYQASDGKVVAARSVSARSNEGLIRALDQLALEISTQVKKAFGVVTPVEPPPPPPPDDRNKKVVLAPPAPPPPPPLNLRAVAWAPAATGLAVGVIGGGLLVLAQFDRMQLLNGTPTLNDAQNIKTRGELLASTGTGLAVAGGVGLAIAGGFYLFGAPKTTTAVTVSPGPAGAMLEVRFP